MLMQDSFLKCFYLMIKQNLAQALDFDVKQLSVDTVPEKNSCNIYSEFNTLMYLEMYPHLVLV